MTARYSQRQTFDGVHGENVAVERSLLLFLLLLLLATICPIRHRHRPYSAKDIPPPATPSSHGVLALAKMNSLNIITARVSPSSSPTPSRSNSIGPIADVISDEKSVAEKSQDKAAAHEQQAAVAFGHDPFEEPAECDDEKPAAVEETPLLHETKEGRSGRWWHSMPRGFVSSILNSLRWILATLASPGVYLMACLYDEQSNFAPMTQLKKLFGVRKGGLESYAGPDGAPGTRSSATSSSVHGWGYRSSAPRPVPSSAASSTSGASSDSEVDDGKASKRRSGGGRGGGGGVGDGRPKTPSPGGDDSGTGRRSIRIKLHGDEAQRRQQRKNRRTASATKTGEDERLLAQIKSPTSPIAALTRYPKMPAPPRPLIPRRQPSYLNMEAPTKHQKTLILDLDETLIHSMSKGGRMSTGHMVEVRLNAASLGLGSQSGAAQHPILYWVNKRPFCDEFLRRVCKWFNLVIFTASVQEYADPVIDWLESERKFFSARYYRQHCSYRQGAYIKDLSSVEPDLSKANRAADNAIPIQGWINDPTDNDLMHLVPLLEGLQYVHDVRALLALRGGEDGQHMG
ncbi:NIF domain protein [Drechmeria coniospora]|uniref:NIF domain protein n=1 Tax=Drechmeria coniospora TaxID=98403 RepID=A0A151GTX9_DRECN|nr:NIF domain protein [Drechmeria coniospora]KYK60530.1 NIF domain protein [Drechmeria coniospora]